MISFYVGLSDRYTKNQISDINYYYNNLINIFQSHNINGLTITQAVGVYNGQRENSLIVSVTNKLSSTDIVYISNDIKEKLNQECVLVQIIDDEIRMV